MNNHGAQACDNPYITNIQECFDQEDLLCFAVNQGCFNGYTLPSAGEFTDCMIEYFYQTENSGNDSGNACADHTEAFIEAHDLPWSAFDLAVLLGGFEGHCESAEEFEGYVMEKLEAINNTAFIIMEGDSIREMATLILPISCESFHLTEDLPGVYETSLTNQFLTFSETQLFPPKLRNYVFHISMDIRVAVPFGVGPLPCKVKNDLARAVNATIKSVVKTMGRNRQYLLPNGSDVAEAEFEFKLEKELKKYFSLGIYVQVPGDNFLSAPSPIPAAPGEEYNCCD